MSLTNPIVGLPCRDVSTVRDAIVQVPVYLISVAVEDLANDLEEVVVMILPGRIVGRRSINVN